MVRGSRERVNLSLSEYTLWGYTVPTLIGVSPYFSRPTPMAESAHVRAVEVRSVKASDSSRHSFLVRITHWITTVSFLALLLSGIAILLAHQRLYWGETGGVGAPSLIDLPLPFVLGVPIRGPGRYLHFLSAWILVLTGLVYVVIGIVTHHGEVREDRHVS